MIRKLSTVGGVIMKTKFQKVDGRWVVPTGKVVAADYINMGDDFDVILADQYIDVCTEETFVKQRDDIMSDIVGEPIWHLVKHYEEMPEYNHHRHGSQKKINRRSRIDDICGVHWTKPFDMKRIGKNRKMSRIMYPNSKQLAEFEDYLPF